MSKAYSSNLTQDPFDLLNDLIPEAKPGGCPREVQMWDILNAIFYVLVEGVRWRALPGGFPPWQTVYTYFRNWRKDGTWIAIHDRLREWNRIEREPHASPLAAVIDSQSVQVVLRPEQSKGFVLLKKRWVVERTFGWLMGCRRLVREYELLPQISETWIYLAMIRILDSLYSYLSSSALQKLLRRLSKAL